LPAQPVLVDRAVDRLTLPSEADRQAMRAAGEHAHDRMYDDSACLGEVEFHPVSGADTIMPDRLRVVAWNAERCKHVAASTALLEASGAQVALMTEMDDGMARSGQKRTLHDVAETLGAGYAFAVEFIELGLGDAREQGWHAGEDNARGLHGNGVLAKVPLARPAAIRLERTGRWFVEDIYQKRVGGRIAVASEVAVDGARVAVAAVHFESHTDRADRGEQMRTLIAGMQAYAPNLPWLIGGDFNANSLDASSRALGPEALAEALAEDPGRFTDPTRLEPLFAVAAEHGLDWQASNVAGATTTRDLNDGTPPSPHTKIDWFFSRGLQCSDPAVIPAVDASGGAISDHEAIAVTIGPA